MKRLWLILFVFPLLAQDINKHNISLGMYDDKTGLSLIGYTYNIRQTEMDEFFIGAGTMILVLQALQDGNIIIKSLSFLFILYYQDKGLRLLGFLVIYQQFHFH
tara:strand:+ start:43 stop:354 length:312 start_codon:yes stop_codon:yes gene_type:complete